jgi:hypothetical protein
MPVTAPLRVPSRHDHQMAEARRDLLLAARADVGLASLKRMNEAHLELSAGFGCAVAGPAGVHGHGVILASFEGPMVLGDRGARLSTAPEAVTPAR